MWSHTCPPFYMIYEEIRQTATNWWPMVANGVQRAPDRWCLHTSWTTSGTSGSLKRTCPNGKFPGKIPTFKYRPFISELAA